MGPLATQCPHCRVKIQLKNPDWAGRNVQCPRCSAAFVVKPLATPVPSAVASAPTAKKSQAATKPAAGAKPAKPAARKSSAVAKAPAGDIDFPVAEPVDDVEILDADEVIAEPAGDDDWLNALDKLAPKAPTGSRTAGAPAPVAGKPKKQKPSTGKKRRRSLRDPDGEFPLWLSRLIMIGTGALAGIFCMIGWAALTYHTGRPSSYMAMFIGASVGTGVRMGASKWDFGWFPAITASVIALAAIIGGKVHGVSSLRAEAAQEFQAEQRRYVEMLKHPNYAIHLVAIKMESEQTRPAAKRDEGAEQAPEDVDPDTVEGERAEMPLPGMALAGVELEDDFGEFAEFNLDSYLDPQELPKLHSPQSWTRASSHWETMPDTDKAELRAQIDQDIKNAAVEPSNPLARHVRIHGDANTAVLSIFDFIFAAIALVMAFRIAAGFADVIGQTDQAQY